MILSKYVIISWFGGTYMSGNELTESKIGQLLDWAYEKSINGLPGTDTAFEIAENYLSKHDSIDKAIDKLIIWQNTKSATSGFLTGLGGLITLPVPLLLMFK